jgi:hypothetical protein
LLNVFVGMVLIIIFWIIAIFIFLGLGILIYRLLRFEISSENNVFFFFWSGIAITTLILQLWHIWFRIDWKTSVFISILGLSGLTWHWKSNLEIAREKLPKSKIFWLLILIVTIIVANFSFGGVRPYDAGLYHLQAIRWIKQYPVVPGLGNLHSRLAFNNSNFLFAAMLEQNIRFLKSFRVTSGLFLLLLFIHLSVSAFRLLSKIKPWGKTPQNRQEEIRSHEIFESLLLPSVINIILRGSTAGVSPDIPIFILGIVISSKLLKLLTQEKKTKEDLFFIFIISALGITIKVSFFAFGLIASLIALMFSITNNERKSTLKKAPVFYYSLAFAALLLIPWIVRNVILSGYLIYPSTFISFPVEWRLPIKEVINEARWIQSWARLPGNSPDEVLGNWNWVGPWVSRILSKENIFDIFIPIVLALEGILLFCLNNKSQHKNKKSSLQLWPFLILPILNLIFWFLSAPSLRFAGSSFWILGVGAFVLSALGFTNFRKIKVVIFCNFLIIIFLGIGEQLPDFMQSINRRIQSVPVEQMKKFETNSGLIIYIPEEGDQCWDYRLPCTPCPKSDLQLRDKKDISKGFKRLSERNAPH